MPLNILRSSRGFHGAYDPAGLNLVLGFIIGAIVVALVKGVAKIRGVSH